MYTLARVQAESVAPEHVMSFLAALLLLYQPVKNLARVQGVLEPGRAALERIWSVLGISELCPQGGTAKVPGQVDLIELEDVTQRRGHRLVLNGVNARFERGKIHAIAGPNGAGKTTLAWLIARMNDPHQGEIRVNGIKLKTLEASAWRRRIGWVTQQPMLGAGTLRENVCFGLDAVSDDQLRRAADLSGVTEILDRSPDGWGHILGEAGAGLSGGEQQRIAIARALINDPDLILADEPTGNLDPETSEEIIRLLFEISNNNKTIIMATHDYDLIKKYPARTIKCIDTLVHDNSIAN